MMHNESTARNDQQQSQGASGMPAERAQQQQQSQPQQPPQRQQPQRDAAALLPAVDVVETQDGITLHADMPGVSRDGLDIQVEAGSLTIEGEFSLDLPEGMQASYADVGLARYRRVFTLSKELDADKVSADLRNGVLTLRIPKAAHAQPRRIQVNAG